MLMPFFLTHAERPSFSRPISLCMVTITHMSMYIHIQSCTFCTCTGICMSMCSGGGGGGYRSRILPDQPKWGCYGPDTADKTERAWKTKKTNHSVIAAISLLSPSEPGFAQTSSHGLRSQSTARPRYQPPHQLCPFPHIFATTFLSLPSLITDDFKNISRNFPFWWKGTACGILFFDQPGVLEQAAHFWIVKLA